MTSKATEIDGRAANVRDSKAALRCYRRPTLTKGPALAVITAQVVIVSGRQIT
jgi:hypothetical protein